ncbi:MAG: agmatine deiminase family protein [Epsilonproteobacteria bacterium]|nr:agmatine deiminase family protein [Campylobacterota bacterium]
MFRLPAEWEKQDSIMLTFPHSKSDWIYCLDEIEKTYTQMIKAISRYQKCLVICDDIQRVKTILKDIDNPNIIYAQIPTNDTWIRDYGAIDVFNDDKIISYDFIFNGWGGKFEASLDNRLNKRVYENKLYKNTLKSIDFILEGGSIDSNGKGVLLTTTKCLLNNNRNSSHSQKEIENLLKKLFGLNRILWLENGYLEGDDTDSHVDTLARFVDEKSIVYTKCYDKNDKHFFELDKMEKELQKSGFNLIPLPLPSAKFYKNERLPATYINFLLLNDALLVPVYNDEKDNEVLEFFKSFYKNRDIIPIDSTTLIKEHGSIHCATINRWATLKG